MLAHVPSPSGPQSEDDSQLATDPRLAHVRSQVAVVRAVADQIEHLSRREDGDGLDAQLIEEMTRLGCRLLEAAAFLAESRSDDSGVFARRA
jgi:hypothetical protein